jgi:hypothetical protein
MIQSVRGLTAVVFIIGLSSPSWAQLMPPPDDFGGLDVTVGTDTVIPSGEWYNIRNFRLESGVTLTMTGPNARIIIRAETITILGTINGNGTGSPGGPDPIGSNDPFTSTGGGVLGGSDPAGAGGGGGGGHAGTGGSGGAGAGAGGTAGAGGAATEPGGIAGFLPVFAAANTPVAPPPRDTTLGGPGGGGGGDDGGVVGGRGGNGGGTILLLASEFISIGISGYLTLHGVAGADASGPDAGGGGGGAGGGVMLCAPAVTMAGIISAWGRPGGNGAGGGGGGGGGAGGVVEIFRDTLSLSGVIMLVAGGGGAAGGAAGASPGAAGSVGVLIDRIENFPPRVPTNGPISANDPGTTTVTTGGIQYTNDLSPVLSSSAFIDRNVNPANDLFLSTHGSSRWMIRSRLVSADDYDPPNYIWTSSTDLTSHALVGPLFEGGLYFVVAHRDLGSSAAPDALGAYIDLFSRAYPSTRTGSVIGDTDNTVIRRFSAETFFAIDVTPPPLPTLNLPAAGTCFNTNIVTLDWFGVTDPNLADGITPGSGLSRYDVFVLDSTASVVMFEMMTGSPPSTNITLAALPEGTYTWSVNSFDALLNTPGFVGEFRAFSIDLTAPPTPVLLSPPDGTFSTDPVTLDWSNTPDPALADGTAGSGLASYNVQVASDPNFFFIEVNTTISGSPPASSVTLAPLPAGTHYWRVRSRDACGNVSAFSGVFSFGTGGASTGGLGAGSGRGGGGGGGCLSSAMTVAPENSGKETIAGAVLLLIWLAALAAGEFWRRS